MRGGWWEHLFFLWFAVGIPLGYEDEDEDECIDDGRLSLIVPLSCHILSDLP